MKGEMEDNELAEAFTQAGHIFCRRDMGSFSKDYRDDKIEVT